MSVDLSDLFSETAILIGPRSCQHQHTAAAQTISGNSGLVMEVAAKKKRCANLQYNEKELLVDLITKHRSVVDCKATDTVSVKMKQEAWSSLANELNGISTSGINREPQQLKHVCKHTCI